MNTNDELLRLIYDQTFKTKAKESNYSPDSIELTWEEYDSIPCITEREAN
tara:strand:+ start:298 stop:447 length:150 start_codon:yes stop_codon:yes gene_type:complete